VIPIDGHLARLSGVLRHQIGPAVTEPFPRTQAFMAAVVLDKLARQLATEDQRAVADRRDLEALRADLDRADLPSPVADAVAALAPSPPGEAPPPGEAVGDPAGEALGRLVEALYATRAELGGDRFAQLLARVRVTLRARLDRQLEYAA
jgi:hypothetical protein